MMFTSRPYNSLNFLSIKLKLGGSVDKVNIKQLAKSF